jgi:hypothetical protein
VVDIAPDDFGYTMIVPGFGASTADQQRRLREVRLVPNPEVAGAPVLMMQCVKQSLGLPQRERVEALGEPAVNGARHDQARCGVLRRVLGVRLLRDGKDSGLEFSAYLAHCFRGHDGFNFDSGQTHQAR